MKIQNFAFHALWRKVAFLLAVLATRLSTRDPKEHRLRGRNVNSGGASHPPDQIIESTKLLLFRLTFCTKSSTACRARLGSCMLGATPSGTINHRHCRQQHPRQRHGGQCERHLQQHHWQGQRLCQCPIFAMRHRDSRASFVCAKADGFVLLPIDSLHEIINSSHAVQAALELLHGDIALAVAIADAEGCPTDVLLER